LNDNRARRLGRTETVRALVEDRGDGAGLLRDKPADLLGLHGLLVNLPLARNEQHQTDQTGGQHQPWQIEPQEAALPSGSMFTHQLKWGAKNGARR